MVHLELYDVKIVLKKFETALHGILRDVGETDS